MRIGVGQVDITPLPGGELCGFAARIQPSTGVLDPLFAKVIYLTDHGRQLLWVHCDLIGFDGSIVANFRRWAQDELGLKHAEVMLSATHTHSGPPTIHLEAAGAYDSTYAEFLQRQLRAAAKLALAHTEAASLVHAAGNLDLAVDRRKKPSSHTESRVGGVGFRRPDGTFVAAILNYAIHPVALGPTNRAVSADLLGRAAASLAERLPGRPLVLATNGACGNLDPPALDVSVSQLETWGRQIADAVAPALATAPAMPGATFSTAIRVTSLPLDVLDPVALATFTEGALERGPRAGAWRPIFRGVVEHWRDALLAAWKAGSVPQQREVELFAINFGGVTFVGINAEVFSRFAEGLRQSAGQPVYVLSYANGDLGYLPTREAYAEGGYEVDEAHLFYGGFRFKAGALEQLAASAADLAHSFSH